MEANPYAPPQADIAYAPPLSKVEVIRQEHIKTENSIRAIGTLYYVVAFAFVAVGSILFFSDGIPRTTPTIRAFHPLTGPLLLVLGSFQGWVAYGLRRLQISARIPAAILAGIGLLAIGLGTIISALILHDLCNKRATMVFSDEYKQIIAETPQVRQKTSKGALIVLWIFLAVLALALIAAFAL